jgi:hypothetical protein
VNLRISVLAWGSIVWDRQALRVVEDFKATGPRLPIEFCRISLDGRLTLVIDEAFGTLCATYSAVSSFSKLDAAIEDLRKREKMQSIKAVGYTVPSLGRQSSRALERHPKATGVISEWLDANDFNAAVWTALANNFEEKIGTLFSVEAAIQYLERQDEKTLARAIEYIRRAPPEVRTPLRTAVAARWP